MRDFVFPAILIALTALLPDPTLAQDIRVTVQGGVERPGIYTLPKDGRLSTLIEMAGGYAGDSRPAVALLNRASLRNSRKESLEKLISTAEAEAGTSTGEDDSRRVFFEMLKKLEPVGVMRVPLAHLRLLKGGKMDIPLEDRDMLIVPQGGMNVSVAGAVRNGPTSLPYADDLEPEDYMRAAGGLADDADPGRAVIIKIGVAVPVQPRGFVRWNPGRSRWEISAFSEPVKQIEPGDTIVVPRKPSRGSWARKFRNLDTLLMQVAALTGIFPEVP
jgi:protein involved in polysaccharide export with SLBB domain